MVGRIETDRTGRATGLHYHRAGRWRFQRARAVIVAGYSIETPRLLLNSASPAHPHGLANGAGLVGRSLMVHSNDAVWARMEEEIRWYKGPPSMAVCEHWNYDDAKDFPGGYAFMSQGPLPTDFATAMVQESGAFGMDLRRRMADYNRMAGLKMVGEVLPHPDNRVDLAEETDALGLPRARVTFAYGEDDRRLTAHARRFMAEMLRAAGGSDLFETTGTAHLMGGCPMGFSPDDGVVDGEGRAFECGNLWVCDGSVMPTGGGVNPSLTIMANAERIADRLVAAVRGGARAAAR
jgi:choline dehydrogenase-like flavoprotein